MTEGRMPDIVDQGQRLREIRIEPQRTGNCASDLRNFQRVRETMAKMIGEAGGENLRLRLEPPESAGMDDAVAIARVVIAIGMRRLRVAPPPRVAHVQCVRSELHYAQFSVSARLAKERAGPTEMALMTCPATTPVPDPLHSR